jgi:hypothetical protein
MRIFTMIICSMLCCTGLCANQYEDFIKNMSTEKLNKYISACMSASFGYLEEFEEGLYHEECYNRDKGIEFYQKKIKELDFKYSPYEFCFLIEKGFEAMGVEHYDNDGICIQCYMWEAGCQFHQFHDALEEMKSRAGVK